ncbi:hypothetical protein HELRODRAFT_158673 [Helobdella robusta]|uniref:Uncharacterized protein n=1 Tax=Helobdella robusta TaxID=6412 RepID=T1EN39_HELRO|nr:hypothetical protein HELRODRAFT_158673 [Helobdella robusta]ESO12207.1 hypothetical protein HELRODRAFT_158673 [Helobdella robusta]
MALEWLGAYDEWEEATIPTDSMLTMFDAMGDVKNDDGKNVKMKDKIAGQNSKKVVAAWKPGHCRVEEMLSKKEGSHRRSWMSTVWKGSRNSRPLKDGMPNAEDGQMHTWSGGERGELTERPMELPHTPTDSYTLLVRIAWHKQTDTSCNARTRRHTIN